MRNYVILYTIVLLLFLTVSDINAEEVSIDIHFPNLHVDEAIETANSELKDLVMEDTYFYREIAIPPDMDRFELINEDVWDEYGLFSTNEPTKNDAKEVIEIRKYSELDHQPTLQPRYVGRSKNGDWVSNPYYTPDSYPITEIMGRWVWVEYPDTVNNPKDIDKKLISNESAIYLSKLSEEDQIELHKQIVLALDRKFSDKFDEQLAMDEGYDVWMKRAGIIIPPTKVSRGLVQLWHSNGNWYTSVTINPLYHFSPEFLIEKDGADYTDNTIYTNNDTEAITLVNSTEVGEGNETEWVEWYVDGVLHGTRDTTTYTSDTIGGNTVNLTISADTTVTLRVKIAKNDDYKEVTHSIDYVKNTVGGSAATATGDVTIGSDSLGSEDYNTVDGIPTGKDIYARVQTDEYIIDYLFELKTGGSSYTATITGEYDNGGDGTTESFSETRSVSRSYSYYDLAWYYVYEIDQAVVSNYALPTGSITLVPPGSYGIGSTYSLGSLDSSPSSESTDVGTVPRNYNFGSKARSMIDSYSTTDARITISGSQDGTITVTGSGSAPVPGKTDRELYGGETTIQETLANRSNTPSNSVITYSLVNSYNSTATATTDIGLTGNSVTVHSPVVCYPDITSDLSDETQHMSLNASRDQLIIGENFTVDYPLDGQHRSIFGYGNRDYSDTTLNRQIQFSFDTYIGTDDSGGNGNFLEAGTWHDFVPGGEDHTTEEVDYYIPHWNNETSGGVIRFRTIPNNIQDIVSDGYGFNQNDSTSEYKAVESITVELSSKAYGFAITDITDPNWDTHFNDPSLSVPSDAYLGADTLPVMEGKNGNSAYEDYSIKLGYEALFSFITNGGDMTGRDDVVLITPTYYHVNEDGSGRQEVDVYYETKNGFIALGGSQDDKANKMILNKDGRGLQTGEIRDTASVLDSQNRGGNGFDEDKYYDALSGKYEYNIKHEDKLLLTEMQKNIRGTNWNR